MEQRQLRFDTSLVVCEDGAFIADFLMNANRIAHDVTAPYCHVKRGDSAMYNAHPDYQLPRIASQVNSAKVIDGIVKRYENSTCEQAPHSVLGLRNRYLYFSMTKALTCGCVDEVVDHIKAVGLFPFPCMGPETGYFGFRWRLIHRLMMHPRLWHALSKLYLMVKK